MLAFKPSRQRQTEENVGRFRLAVSRPWYVAFAILYDRQCLQFFLTRYLIGSAFHPGAPHVPRNSNR